MSIALVFIQNEILNQIILYFQPFLIFLPRDWTKKLKAREIVLKLLVVIVLKFKAIATYQIAFLLENNGMTEITKSEASSAKTDGGSAAAGAESRRSEQEASKSSLADKVLDEHDKMNRVAKIDNFLSSFEDKDKIKVFYLLTLFEK